LVVVAFRAQLQVIHRDAVDLSVQGEFEGDGVRAEGGEEKERQRGFCCPLAYCSAQYADKPRPSSPPPGEGDVWLFAGCGFPTLTAGDM
jgi:chemotaxis histidine protein kinase